MRSSTLILAFITLQIVPPTCWGQQRPTIALVPARETGVSADLSSYVRTLLEEELTRSGQFDVVDRSQVKEVLEELSFQQSGVTDVQTVTEIGQHLNVEKLFFIRLHRLYPEYKVTIKIVDVATNKVIRLEEQDLGSKPSEVRIPTLKLAQRLVQRASLLVPAEMVYFPPSRYQMGSSGPPDERPPHSVLLSSFFLDRYETSEIAFQAFRESMAKQAISDVANPKRAATLISWFDAADYCGWQGKRLPTEAEWEFAAKGTKQRPYPWGSESPTRSMARFGGYTRGSVDVSEMPEGATPEGIFHLAGNVAEWVQDWWQPDYYSASASQDPSGPTSGDYKVIRGGSWAQPAVEIGTTVRAFHNPNKGSGYIGFRCAKSAREVAE